MGRRLPWYFILWSNYQNVYFMTAYLMDWSCCFWRASSDIGAKAPCAPLIGVVGADLFFWREWSSSIVWALTGGVLSSWHTSQLLVWFLGIWIFGSPWLRTGPLFSIFFCLRDNEDWRWQIQKYSYSRRKTEKEIEPEPFNGDSLRERTGDFKVRGTSTWQSTCDVRAHKARFYRLHSNTEA